MATARRCYLAASAAALLLMLGRLGLTDRPSILQAAAAVGIGLALLLGLVLLLALMIGVPVMVLLAIISGCEALFGRRMPRPATPVPAGPPGGKEAA